MNRFFRIFQRKFALKETVKRFPVEICLSIITTVLTIIAITSEFERLTPWILLCILLFIASLAGSITSEHFSFNGIKRFTLPALLMALFGLLFALQIGFQSLSHASESMPLIHASLSAIALGLLLALPFLHKRKSEEYSEVWNYWFRLGLAFTITFSLFYAVEMFFLIFLGSFDLLFDQRMNTDEVYAVNAGIVLPLSCILFLLQVPTVEKIREPIVLDRWVKWLSFGILFPTASAYLLLLYAYSAKILFAREWPSGEVAGLVLGFSSLGLFTFFFTRALQGKMKSARIWGTLILAALIPQAIVLMLSAGVRVNAYGITESRYMLFAFAIWLLVSASYLLIFRKKSLTNIVWVGIAVLFIATIMPVMNMRAVSYLSQANRMIETWENAKEEAEITESGLYQIKQDVADQMRTDIGYLIENHQGRGLRGIVPEESFEELDAILQGDKKVYEKTNAVFSLLAIYESKYPNRGSYFSGYGYDSLQNPLSVQGYEYFSDITLRDEKGGEVGSIRLQQNSDKQIVLTFANGRSNYLDISPLVEKVRSDRKLFQDRERNVIVFEDEKVRAKLIVTRLEFYYDEGIYNPESIDFYFLYTLK